MARKRKANDVIDLTGSHNVPSLTADLLIAASINGLLQSCNEDVEKLTRLSQVAESIQNHAEKKIQDINAVTKKCSMSSCKGDGTLEVERCQCQSFRTCTACAEVVHYCTDSEDEDEYDDRSRESRDLDDQRERLEGEGAGRCRICNKLLCDGCMNPSGCEYCNGILCEAHAITSLCENTTYCEECEAEHECPDCDICEGYAPPY